MDVKGIFNTVTRAGTTSLARAMPTPAPRLEAKQPAPLPAQSRTLIENISQNQRLSPPERSGLVKMAAFIDQANLSTTDRQIQFERIAQLGVYLQETAPTDFPQWPVLTGLRFYSGMHVKLQGADIFQQDPSTVLSAMQNNLMAQARNTSPEAALAQVAQKPSQVLRNDVSQFVGQNTTQIEVSGVASPKNNAATPINTIDKQV